jgi:carboxymethylenebutenolidase
MTSKKWWSVSISFVLAMALGSLACSPGPEPTSEDEHMEAMEREHAEDAPVATEAATASPSMDVRGETVVYATIDGADVEGYLAEPESASGPLPSVVVIHEWWGLNDNIRAMADQLAGEGYRALAVDLYDGQQGSTPDEAAALMRASMEKTEALHDNLSQAIAYLEENGTNIGTIGWCFGGGWSLQAALASPDRIDATVIYYGRLTSDEAELEKLNMPILGIFGAEDQGIPGDSVRAFESALDSLGKDAAIHVYDGADHAFANPSGTNYQAEAAADAWEKTLAFFEQHLKS